jgi:hypothetical protein
LVRAVTERFHRFPIDFYDVTGSGRGDQMDINLGEEKIVELVSSYSLEDVKAKALAKRIDAFGQLARFVQRPKPEEIELLQMEKRFEPFWYGLAKSRYSYDRRHRFDVPVSPEVQSVTFYDHDHAAQRERGNAFQLDAVEHCVEENKRELMLDPIRGDERDYSKYLSYGKNIVPNLEALQADGAVVVPPEVRSSFLVRKLVQMLMKTFQADKILEERIDVEEVILYYRPVHAFEYFWKAKDKRAVVEFDALTGEVRAEGGQIKKQVVNVLENDALFDIGADAVGTVLPGVNVVVKLGRFAARKVIR